MSIASQPEKIPPPFEQPTPSHDTEYSRARYWRTKITTRHGWIGDYDYGWLCTPRLPWSLRRNGPARRVKSSPPFYGLDSELPLLMAAANGLQHALAMLAGLITPPIIFASALNLDSATSAYMISASLIGCGKFAISVAHTDNVLTVQ